MRTNFVSSTPLVKRRQPASSHSTSFSQCLMSSASNNNVRISELNLGLIYLPLITFFFISDIIYSIPRCSYNRKTALTNNRKEGSNIHLFNGGHVIFKIKCQRSSPENTISYPDLKTSKEDIQNISLRTSGVWTLVRNTHCHDCFTAFGNFCDCNVKIVQHSIW